MTMTLFRASQQSRFFGVDTSSEYIGCGAPAPVTTASTDSGLASVRAPAFARTHAETAAAARHAGADFQEPADPFLHYQQP